MPFRCKWIYVPKRLRYVHTCSVPTLINWTCKVWGNWWECVEHKELGLAKWAFDGRHGHSGPKDNIYVLCTSMHFCMSATEKANTCSVLAHVSTHTRVLIHGGNPPFRRNLENGVILSVPKLSDWDSRVTIRSFMRKGAHDFFSKIISKSMEILARHNGLWWPPPTDISL